MALVAYSDSEGSDTEGPAPAPIPTPAPAAAAKPPKSSLSSFLPPPSKKRKLVEDAPNSGKSGPRKIIIDLPKIAPENPEDADDPNVPRRKVGKSGSGMLSFLPAPKRTGADALKVAKEGDAEEKKKQQQNDGANGDSILQDGKGSTGNVAPARTLGGGLKKAEYAGTSMDAQSASENDMETAPEEANSAPVTTKPAGPIQGRVIQPFFRKTTTKKATPGGASTVKKEEKKVSLFSLGSALDERPQKPTSIATGEYKPLLVNDSAAPHVEDIAPSVEEDYQMDYTHDQAQGPVGPTFQSIGEEVGMDDADLRMFMGRRGRNAEIKIMDYNVDREYEKNEKARVAGELAPERNVIRSIKPGKHQLSSLVNAAQSQKAALEESFAQGRRNKKEAGSKYGW